MIPKSDLREVRREIEARLSARDRYEEDEQRFHDLVWDLVEEFDELRDAVTKIREDLFDFDPKEETPS